MKIICPMPSLKITTMYTNGVLSYAHQCEPTNIYAAEEFGGCVQIQPSPTISFGRRMKVPSYLLSEVEASTEINKHMSPLYNHWSLKLGSKIPCFWHRYRSNQISVQLAANHYNKLNGAVTSFHRAEECEWEKLAKVRDLVTKLMIECSERDPREFDNTGRDLSWYYLGSHFLVAYAVNPNADAEEICGYMAIEGSGKTLKVWTSYILPEYRGSRVFASLLAALLDYAVINSYEAITGATDVTQGNPLNRMLEKRGCQLDTVTYRTN